MAKTCRAVLLGLHRQVCSYFVTVLAEFFLVVVLGVAFFGFTLDRVRALSHHRFLFPRLCSWFIVYRVCQFLSTQVPPASDVADSVGWLATICAAARS